jgi:hypothetical protein
LQCAAAGGAVEAADDLFVPFFWDRAPEGFCSDTTVLIQADDRERARVALGAAVSRMELVIPSGHEYDDENEEHEDSLWRDEAWDLYTVSSIGSGAAHPLGPWVWIDGYLTAAMTSTMLRILIEEVQRAGLTGAVLRSGRRASRGDHTPDHA